MKIALVSCSSKKQVYPCAAKQMYQPSQLFSLSYQYAKQHADRIYILSAKYGLLDEDQVIKPYDMALKDMPENRQKDWANYVLSQMRDLFDLEKDTFMILSGRDYYKNLIPSLFHYTLPLGNRMLGERISFLQQYLQSSPSETDKAFDLCTELHKIFNALPRFTYQQIDQIPFECGIYIIFEKGETYSGLDRIVRVGTHNSQGRLKNRLKDHFLQENKDGSIFRKNIGKAILNKDQDPYLPIWTLNTSKPESYRYIARQIQDQTEKRVSDYLMKNITFTVFPVNDQTLRLRLEKGIIATLNQAKDFSPQPGWLGQYSPEFEIRTSGLWLKEGLNDQPVSSDEMQVIRNSLKDWEKGISNDRTSHEKALGSSGRYGVKTTVNDIRNYIKRILEEQKKKGNTECILVSGDIHRSMKLSNQMPTVCNAMYQLMKLGDEILHTTPSGKSSTIKIRYKL